MIGSLTGGHGPSERRPGFKRNLRNTYYKAEALFSIHGNAMPCIIYINTILVCMYACEEKMEETMRHFFLLSILQGFSLLFG